MNVLLVMIPLSVVLLFGAAAAFFWAVDCDQFDDMETPGLLPVEDNPRRSSLRNPGDDDDGSQRTQESSSQ